MNNRNKKIFLAISIAVPFLIYCFYYYGIMLKNAPYRFADLESITLKYGMGTNLVNQYDSRTGNFQYENSRDSLVKTNVKLSKDDMLYLNYEAKPKLRAAAKSVVDEVRDKVIEAEENARKYQEKQ